MSIAVFKGVTTRWRLSGVPAETATVAVYCQSGAVRFEVALASGHGGDKYVDSTFSQE